MMKKIILSMLCCLFTVGAMAVETTDIIKLSTATITPGGDEVEITVSLVGTNTNLYAGYNMDIFIPDGFEVLQYSDYNEDDDEYTYYYCKKLMSSTGGINKSSHNIGSQLITINGKRALRVACFSQSNATLRANTGNLFTIKVKASSFTKPGTAQITIDGVALKVAGGYEYVPASRVDENITVSTNATTAISISGTNNWSTCILPFDCPLPDGVKAYSCTDKDDENSVLKLSPANSITGYTPYILYSEDGYSGPISGTVDPTKYPEKGFVAKGLLNGAITNQQITDGFVMQKINGIVKFYDCDGQTFNIPAGKCWVTMPEATGAKAWSFVIEGEQTNINSIEHANANTTIYNIGGQRMKNMLQKGIYITNGKKIIIK